MKLGILIAAGLMAMTGVPSGAQVPASSLPSLSPSNSAAARAQLPPARAVDYTRLAFSKPWLRLLHYIPNGRGYKSELDGREFFFSPTGKVDPEAELRASAAAFAQNLKVGRLQLHPQCAFPERFRFLREALKLNYALVPCPKYEEFLQMYHGPKAVTLVFSSAYPNNPASMFGHTFLKIRSRRKNDLLNMGINFAAFTGPNMNMLLFIYQGVFGGYRGIWSMEPYFTKVNEYVNAESRDLWEYDLTLSEQETLRLLGHLWELETTSFFEYFFFDENCSYQIMRALEAIKWDWDLASHRIYVIPGETTKRVVETPGAVEDVKFRPSLYHQLQIRYQSLRPQERKAYHEVVEGPSSSKIPPSPEALDAAALYALYSKAKKKRKWSAQDQAQENRILALRAQAPPPTLAPIPDRYYLTRPDIGHHPYSFYFGGGYLETRDASARAFGRLKLRTAYHDLLSPDPGYAPFTEIEFPWLEAQVFGNELRVHEFGLLNITSLFPLNAFSRQASWRVKMALETERGAECLNCLVPGVEVGGGGSVGNSGYRFYALAIARAESHSHLAWGHRLRVGLESGTIWSPSSHYKTRLVGRLLWDAPYRNRNERTYDFTWDHSLALNKNNEIRQSSTLTYGNSLGERTWSEFQLQWVKYFR